MLFYLHFKTLFGVGRDGKMYKELPAKYTSELPGNLNPLFELIIESVPNATHDKNKPFQMLISTLDYDNYVGRLCIGEVSQGVLKKDQPIVLVQDNLNTHNPSSFYEVFDAPEAFALSQRFEMVYTPKKASWLNMAEIELSALSKQCLDRRIDQRRILAKEVMAWSAKRNRLGTKITWHFTNSKARVKLDRVYDTIKN